MFISSRVLVLVAFILTWHSFPSRILAQSAERVSEEETQELLDTMAGKHPSLDLNGVLQRLRNVDNIPDALVPSIIETIGSQSHFARFQATRLLKKIDCDLERATLLVDSVGKLTGYRADHMRLEELVDWITMPDGGVVPLLHRTVMRKANSHQQRTLALLGLARLKPLPDPVIDDLSTLMKTPAGSWSEAAMILAKSGERGEEKLVSLLESPNEWERVRAAGALEVEFPRKYPRAMVVLLRIAHSDYHRNRLGSCMVSPNEEAVAFLGQTGPQNTLSMLEVGLHCDSRGGRMRSALNRMKSIEAYEAEILEAAMPVLKGWLRDEKRRDGALLWYQALGRENAQAIIDLAAVLKTTDDDFGAKIVHTIKTIPTPGGGVLEGSSASLPPGSPGNSLSR